MRSGDILVARPKGRLWAAVATYGLMGILIPLFALLARPGNAARTPDEPAVYVLLGLVGAMLLLPAAVRGVWICRAAIVADDGGLRWRTFGGWRSAAWDQVTDYYLVPSATQNRSGFFSPWATVETRSAGHFPFSPEWVNYAEMREQIQARATSARAKEWDVRGVRASDGWPRVFGYRRRDAWGAWLGAGLYSAGVAYLSALFSGRIVEVFRLLGAGWALAMAGTVGLIFVALPFFAAAMSVRSAAELRRRLDERFTVTPASLTFAKGAHVVSVPWEGVAGFRVVRAAGSHSVYELILRGSGERHLTFTSAIQDSGLLMRIVARYAPAAAEAAARTGAPIGNEALGDVSERRSGGIAGSGARVFHYRTRDARALLAFPLCFAGLIGLLSWLSAHGYTKNGGEGAPSFGIPFTFLLLWLWCLWRYRAARIEVDEFGIAQRTPLGVRRLPWLAVVDYHGTGDPCVVEGRDGTRLRFYASLIADARELRAQIERRAPKPRTGWVHGEGAAGAGVQKTSGEREVIQSTDGLEVTPDGGDSGRTRRQARFGH